MLDVVVVVARGESGFGDGTFEDTFDCEEGGSLGIGNWRCTNDLEFGGVSWRPYLDKQEEDKMNVD